MYIYCRRDRTYGGGGLFSERAVARQHGGGKWKRKHAKKDGLDRGDRTTKEDTLDSANVCPALPATSSGDASCVSEPHGVAAL